MQWRIDDFSQGGGQDILGTKKIKIGTKICELKTLSVRTGTCEYEGKFVYGRQLGM